MCLPSPFSLMVFCPASDHILPASLSSSTCSRDGLTDRRIKPLLRHSSGKHQGIGRHTDLEPLPVHLQEEAYSPLCLTVFQRVRIGAESCLGTCKDPFQRPALFLVGQQALLFYVRPSALLARSRTALLGLAQIPIVVAAWRLTPWRCKSPVPTALPL